MRSVEDRGDRSGDHTTSTPIARSSTSRRGLHIAQIVDSPVREPQVTNQSGDDAATPQAAAAKVRMLMERLKAWRLVPRPCGRLLGGSRIGAARRRPRPGSGFQPEAGPAAAARRGRGKDAWISERRGRRRRVHAGACRRPRAGRATRPVDAGCKRPHFWDAALAQGAVSRAAYLTAARSDATVVNYLARRLVESKGAVNLMPSAPRQ